MIDLAARAHAEMARFMPKVVIFFSVGERLPEGLESASAPDDPGPLLASALKEVRHG
jgi:hypothetical protein